MDPKERAKQDDYLRFFYEWTATRIERQDRVANQRLTWTLTSQSILVAAFALSHGGSGQQPGSMVVFRAAIVMLGVVLGVAGHLGARGALLAIRQLQEAWIDRLGEFGLAPSEDPFPKMVGSGASAACGFFPAKCVALAFAGAWIAVGVQLLWLWFTVRFCI